MISYMRHIFKMKEFILYFVIKWNMEYILNILFILDL